MHTYIPLKSVQMLKSLPGKLSLNRSVVIDRFCDWYFVGRINRILERARERTILQERQAGQGRNTRLADVWMQYISIC